MAGWVSEVAMFTINPVILREQNVLDMFKKSPHLFQASLTGLMSDLHVSLRSINSENRDQNKVEK